MHTTTNRSVSIKELAQNGARRENSSSNVSGRRTLCAIERMLESADHLIEKHRDGPARSTRAAQQPDLPAGWILYSAEFTLEGAQKGWRVELMDTSRPYQMDSIVKAWHKQSLDAALKEASHKVPASRSEASAYDVSA